MAPSVSIPTFDPTTGAAIAKALEGWYLEHARVLPWRTAPLALAQGHRPDPYAVLVSEVALQQTTVAVGSVRVPQLLAQFPTVDAMANAPVEEVVDAWAGLGYYARARRLHAAVQTARSRHGGVPVDEASLLALPGVGAYTAAAVAAIAGGQRAVVVDGNVERVMARVFAIDTPLPRARPIIRAAADSCTPNQGAGNHAQTVMDLAATVCRPKAPRCGVCPVATWCQARAQGDAESYPRKSAKKPKPHRKGMCTVLVNPSRGVLVERRPDAGLLGGTLGFPGGDWRAQEDVDERFAVEASWCNVGSVRHTFAHFTLELEVWLAVDASAAPASNALFFMPLEGMNGARFSSLFAKAWSQAWPGVVGDPAFCAADKDL